MAKKITGAQAAKLDALDAGQRNWDRVHKLIEMAASSPVGVDDLLRQCHRTVETVGRNLANNGFGDLAMTAMALAAAIKRPGALQMKLGAMREGVAKGGAAFDRARRKVLQE